MSLISVLPCVMLTTTSAFICLLVSTAITPTSASLKENGPEEVEKNEMPRNILDNFSYPSRSWSPLVALLALSPSPPHKNSLDHTNATLLAEIMAAIKEIKETKNNQGSTFVRWGRTTCPDKSELVYSGIAAGKDFREKGSGTNHLCLSRTPQYGRTFPSSDNGYGRLLGGEYENFPGHVNQDVPCALCRAPLPTTVMVPATRTCPTGWTTQYTGLVSAQHLSAYYATEYVCLDDDLEHVAGGSGNSNGHIFYPVVTECGVLPCPPFESGKAVTCVVCSK